MIGWIEEMREGRNPVCNVPVGHRKWRFGN